MKPGLLLSIRDANEARLVSRVDIGIIDVKEPENGALGCVCNSVLEDILAASPADACLSIALGEWNASSTARLDNRLLTRFKYAKIGLAGAIDHPDWQIHWKRELAAIPDGVGRVAVAYLDASLCGAPRIDDIIGWAVQFDCVAVLMDTYHKSAGDLLTHLKPNLMAERVRKIQDHGMLAVVAGSVSLDTLETVLNCNPDFVGIRGAVCQPGRTGTICENKLDQFVNYFSGLVDTKVSFQH